MKKTIFSIAVIVFCWAGFSSTAEAQVVVVRKPVKPTVVVVKPAKPNGNYIWRAGYWTWNNKCRCYKWRKGYWMRAKKGRVWVPGHWKKVPRGHVWVRGHWAKR